MEQINLENYKIIYDFAKEKSISYSGNSKHMGSGWSQEHYNKLVRNENLARHLFISKIKEILHQEKSKLQFGRLTNYSEIEIDSEDYLLVNE